MKYIIADRKTKKFLGNDYYIDLEKGYKDIDKAHKFSAFELLLASRKLLKDKSNYIVYACDDKLSRDKKFNLLNDLLDDNTIL